ncbi:MAG TPA: archease [Actinomycetota bacterium]|jgi:SHS2 domain-containing protein|nr:archease [Actinomycetota bacterium]
MAFEILEHTADVGVRAVGDTREASFEEAARGLAHIAGIWTEGSGEIVEVDLDGEDDGSLLVDWLSELLWLHDARDALVSSVRVVPREEGIRCRVELVPRGRRETEGTQVKAVTYHGLRVDEEGGRWVAVVYLDV